MKFFKHAKDGGPQSTVDGWWLVEIKGLFSIALLRFRGPSRFAYHEHAFNSVNWLLRGQLVERYRGSRIARVHNASLIPIVTRRDHFHMVDSVATSWVLSFRGPWAKTWREYIPGVGMRTLTDGREVCGE